MSDSAKPIRDYKDLLVWQKAMNLAKEVYQWTRNFPAEEKFGLVSQLRRAAVSIPSNVAEGQARNTTGEFIQFISHAEGSLAELDTQLRLSGDFGFLDQASLNLALANIAELQKMFKGLRRSLVTNRVKVSD
jgi:four helix bundle protein